MSRRQEYPHIDLSKPSVEAMLWMIVTEDIDGQWFNDPKVFRTRALAEKWAAGHPPSEGYEYTFYRYIEDPT